MQSYTKSLDLLDDYDHKSLTKPKGTKSDEKITYKNCIDIIKTLKFNEKSDIFAVEKDKGLESIIGNIYQTFDGVDVYESIEDFNMSFGAYQDRFYNLHWKKKKKYELYPILYDYGKK